MSGAFWITEHAAGTTLLSLPPPMIRSQGRGSPPSPITYVA